MDPLDCYIDYSVWIALDYEEVYEIKKGVYDEKGFVKIWNCSLVANTL
jgi:hypothetical protein